MSRRLTKRPGSCCSIADDERDANRSVGRGQDENSGVGGMSFHLYKERKGVPAAKSEFGGGLERLEQRSELEDVNQAAPRIVREITKQ
jgi:hypothetical protein